jgi:probable F420-dependent oxidoreductase
VKFGIAFANTGPFASADGAVAFARAAEAAGFESLWTVEHVLVPSGYASAYPYSPTGRMPGREDAPVPDPLIWLAVVATATSTIRLATGILIVGQRQPAVVAKEVASLDVLSGGRVELGIGVGWLKEEFEALGVPFAERAARTDEAVAAMRALWSEPVASFHGRFTSFTDCICSPRPVRGLVPVHVGGHSDAAAKRAGRLGDGFFPAAGSHEDLSRLFTLAKDTAAEMGRDPSSIEMTTGGNGAVGERALDEVAQLAELGVDRVILPSFLFFKDPEESLARYGESVIARCP